MKHLPPDVADFPSLVRWICDRYHNGKVLPFGKRAGISPALADRWVHGTVKSPSVASVTKLCDAYDRSMLEVMRLITDGRPKPPPLEESRTERSFEPPSEPSFKTRRRKQ